MSGLSRTHCTGVGQGSVVQTSTSSGNGGGSTAQSSPIPITSGLVVPKRGTINSFRILCSPKSLKDKALIFFVMVVSCKKQFPSEDRRLPTEVVEPESARTFPSLLFQNELNASPILCHPRVQQELCDE